jgi:putative ABC transport system permease protein
MVDPAPPPRVATWLLRRLLPAPLREEAADELADLHALRASRDGARAADHWYRWEVVRYALRLRFARLTVSPGRHASHQPRSIGLIGLFAGLGTDLRVAWRVWRRAPGTAAVIVLAIALGVAASATVFSWAEGLIWKPLPAVEEPGRLASLEPRGPAGDLNVAWQEYLDWKQQSRSFAVTAAFGMRRLGLRGAGAVADRPAEPIWATLVSGNYFTALGLRPLTGRLIGPEDTRAEGDGFVAVISEALWRTQFGAEPTVVGRSVVLNGVEVTIVGVAPPAFAGTLVGLAFDVWVPVTIQQALGGRPDALQSRDVRWLRAFGRLRPGIARRQAGLEAASLGRTWAALHPESRDVELSIGPLNVGAAARLAPLFEVLLGLTIVVLVVVCATVANLLLARASTRAVELAVRSAIGARPGRLVRQLLTESMILAAAAGALGVLLTVKARALFPALLPPTPLPIAINTPLDTRVLSFALAITLVTVLLFGVAPAVQAARRAAEAGLRTAESSDPGRTRWRRVLVGAQIALSLTALACTAMFARRLGEVRAVDRGFEAPEHVLLASTDFALAGVGDPAERRAIAERLVSGVQRLPGVQGVTFATFVPLGFTGYREVSAEIPGAERSTDEAPEALLNEVGPDYFAVLGVRIVAGRPIDEGDRAEGRAVVVVNQTLAHRLGLSDPVDRSLRVDGREAVIVGVAEDGKYRFDELDQPARPLCYVPWTQWGGSELTFHLRTALAPLTLVPSVERVFAEADRRLPLLAPTTLEVYTGLPLFPGRLATSLLGALAVGTLALAALGLYAVTSLTLAARRRELVIRSALGATARQLVRLLLGDSNRLTAVALFVGLGLTAGVTRVLVAVLPRLRPDPTAIAVAFGVLYAIAVSAVALAARGASRIDPATVLRGRD